jgi:hypothetical protein
MEISGRTLARELHGMLIGGYYTLHDTGVQLLFCYGHTVPGQAGNYAHPGLYWMWGPNLN